MAAQTPTSTDPLADKPRGGAVRRRGRAAAKRRSRTVAYAGLVLAAIVAVSPPHRQQ